MKRHDTELFQRKTTRTADRVEVVKTQPRKPSPGEIRSLELQIEMLRDRKSFLPRQIDMLRKELDNIPSQISALQRQLQSLRSGS